MLFIVALISVGAFGVLLNPERILAALCRQGQSPTFPDITRSLERMITLESLQVSQKMGQNPKHPHPSRHPKIILMNDPLPYSLPVRSLFGHGTLFVSQGLIHLLNESELRGLLNAQISKLRKSNAVFRSLCCLVSVAFVRLTPLSVQNAGWQLLQTNPLRNGSKPCSKTFSPLSVLCFLILYPWIRFSFRQANTLLNSSPADLTQSSALRKIDQTLQLQSINSSQVLVNLIRQM